MKTLPRFLSTLAGIALLAAPGYSITVSNSSDATALVNALLGPGITLVGTPTLIGASTQQGTFTNGTSEVGFANGIFLTTGTSACIPGPNNQGGCGATTGTGSDADLQGIVGGNTFDKNVLEFQFQFGDGSVGGDLFFNFVFGSEEYNEYVGSQFNDVFGFFVDGENIAKIGNDPITINSINLGQNSAFYVNNAGGAKNIQYDGLTTVLTAQKLGLGAGTHTMKLAIADRADTILDSGVFLQAGTFSNQNPAIPEPSTYAFLALGVAGVAAYKRKRKAA
jgi:hypothetical protein